MTERDEGVEAMVEGASRALVEVLRRRRPDLAWEIVDIPEEGRGAGDHDEPGAASPCQEERHKLGL